ncbi:MAG: hypothetical protein DRJ65_17390 [Acidobacteria bacterium]|nr:MAG: hypothetical protein DRJ65_17390 [Acidobacteriota bacterium]
MRLPRLKDFEMKRSTLALLVATALGLVATPGSTGIWTTWEWLNPRPQGHSLTAVAASDTIVVTVSGSVILTSEDAIDWGITNFPGIAFSDVVWTGEFFVVAGSTHYAKSQPGNIGAGVIMTSTDGSNWTKRHWVDHATLHKICFTGDQIVVVGLPGIVVTSPDGFAWSEHALENFPRSEMMDIAWNGSGFVAIGRDDFADWGSRPVLFLSEDGTTWSRDPLVAFPSFWCNTIVWDGDRFLIFTSYGILSSLNGQQWTHEQDATDFLSWINEVLVSADGYLAVGGAGQVHRSTDGLTWDSTTILPITKTLNDVARFQDRVVTVGTEGAIAVSMDDGQQWDVVTSWAIDLVDSNEIDDLCWAEGVLIAISNYGAIFRSLDGLEWRQVAFFSGGIYSVEWFDEAFWVVGYNRLIAHSVDGIDWSTRREEPGATYVDITSNGEVTVAVGRMAGGSALIGTSVDGFSWTDLEVDDATGLIVLSVTWTGTRFVGVGNEGSIFLSDDGYDWEIETPNSGEWYSLSRVVSNGSVLVAVGSGEDILTSDDDGLTWLPTLAQGNHRDVVWTGELFVVASGQTIHSSRNGHDWISTPVPSGSASFIASQGQEIVFSGSGENLMRAELFNFVPPQESTQESFLD